MFAFLDRNKKKLPEEIARGLHEVRSQSDVLVVCPSSTGFSWLGVEEATKSLFPESTFCIPHYYSNPLLTDSQLEQLAIVINELGFSQVIFSGFLPYYYLVIKNLNTTVKVLYHGTLSELAQNEKQQDALMSLLCDEKSEKIRAIGCVQKGLAFTLSKLYGKKTYEIILPNREIRDFKYKESQEINIGVLVNQSFLKNVHNQIAAALLVEKAVVHTFQTKDLLYLSQDRIVYHELMSHHDFLQILSEMTINLHVTMCESWGQVLSESISLGVPCISADTSAFFDYNLDLKKRLVVSRGDDSWFIYQKINEVLKDLNSIGQECVEYAKFLNVLSKERLDDFLNS